MFESDFNIKLVKLVLEQLSNCTEYTEIVVTAILLRENLILDIRVDDGRIDLRRLRSTFRRNDPFRLWMIKCNIHLDDINNRLLFT